MASPRKKEKKKTEHEDKEEKKKKIEHEKQEEPKKKKIEKHEDKKKKKKNEKEDKKKTKEIDTKGKPFRHAPGGSLLFQFVAVKDTGKKPHQFFIEVIIDEESLYKSKQPSSGTKWEMDEQMQRLNIPESAKQMTVILNEKALIGGAYKGEVRLEMDSLYDGYPHDDWFDLKNKEGKEKSVNGSIKLKIQYIGKMEPNFEYFTYPLHALIRDNRLDIFQKKIDNLQLTKFTTNDKKLTPLLFAAKEGKASFVKLLLENKADIKEEKTPKNRTSLHLAAKGGHVDVIRFLSKQSQFDVNVTDSTELELTPLHLAAENNQSDACALLVKCGANQNIQNVKGNTPLTHALLVQPSSAPQAVPVLVEAGADIYLKNNDGLCAWEIAHRKELCVSAITRTAFLKATDSVDRREFEIMQKTGKKKRFLGKNLTKDWSTSTQWIFTVEKPTKVSILAYSDKRTDNCEKLVAFCLVEGKDFTHRMPTFQQEGIGFGSLKPFEYELKPENAYTAIAYCTDDGVQGDFGFCVFSKKGSASVHGVEAVPWKYTEKSKGAWKDDTAGGSADDKMANEKYILKNSSKEKTDILVMVRQINKTLDALVFADGGHRITPSKYYIGFFVYDENLEKEITRTSRWINSFDVYMNIDLDAEETVVIIPTTQKEGEEVEYEIFAFSDSKIELKKKK